MNLKPATRICACVFVIGVFFFIVFVVIPANFVRSGTNEYIGIVNTLRQIAAARAEWSIVNGYTNAVDMQRVPTQQDISPYLMHGSRDRYGVGFDQNGYVLPVKGITFSINSLGTSPQVTFTRDFIDKTWGGGKIPKGTIMISSNYTEELILPGEKTPKTLPEELGQ